MIGLAFGETWKIAVPMSFLARFGDALRQTKLVGTLKKLTVSLKLLDDLPP